MNPLKFAAMMQKRAMTPEKLVVLLDDRGIRVTAHAVRTWQKGTRIPRPNTMCAITNALGCVVTDLL